MAFGKKLSKSMEWLEHGKTFVDILFALGLGKAVNAGLRQWTRIPSDWVTPIWLFVSALCLWLLMKYWPRKPKAQQDNQSLAINSSDPLSELTPKVVDDAYHVFHPDLTGQTEGIIRHRAQQIAEQGHDKESFLIRFLTVAVLLFQFEAIWYTIYGSQIYALQQLNTGSQKRDGLFTHYATASIAANFLYATYTFDQWLAYLRSQGLLMEVGEYIAITTKGKSFLHYLVDGGKAATDRPY
jgi:hypothetical protein